MSRARRRGAFTQHLADVILQRYIKGSAERPVRGCSSAGERQFYALDSRSGGASMTQRQIQDALPSGEGRWPRICARPGAWATREVERAHVL